MTPISLKCYCFPPTLIVYAVWLYARFTLSFRNVEEQLVERGIDVYIETVRRWFLKFGRLIALNLRQAGPRPSSRWHLDELVIKTAGGGTGFRAPSLTKAKSSTSSSSPDGARSLLVRSSKNSSRSNL